MIDMYNVPYEPKFYISLSGLDGSGKTTQAKLLNQSMTNLQLNSIVCHHRITDNTFFKKAFSYIYTNKIIENISQDDMSLFIAFELLGYYLSLDDNKNVVPIFDRWIFDLFVSQTTIFNSDFKKGMLLLKNLLSYGCNIFIDVPPDICAKRIFERCEIIKSHESYEVLVKKYLKYKELEHKGAFIVVDGTEDCQCIHEKILNVVINKIEEMSNLKIM